MDNIYQIDSDFVYDAGKPISPDGIELPEVRNEKIGYNNSAGRKKDLFANGVVPVLYVSDGQKMSDLENTAAIRRKNPKATKRN